MTDLNENAIEQMALEELRALGWKTAFGPDIASDGPTPEREKDYRGSKLPIFTPKELLGVLRSLDEVS